MGIERIYVFVGVYIFFFAQVFVCSEHKLAATNENTHKTFTIKESGATTELLTNENDIYKENDKYNVSQGKQTVNNECGYNQDAAVLINVNETSLVNNNLKNKRKSKTQNKEMIKNDHVTINIPESYELSNSPLHKNVTTSKRVCAEFALECNNIRMLRLCQGLTLVAIIIIILHLFIISIIS